jgi:hypothetical protein
MTKQKLSAKGAEALFGAALLYSLSGPLVREMSYMWGDKAQVAVRWALVWVMLLTYFYARKTKIKVPRNKLPYAIGLSLAFASLCFLPFQFKKPRSLTACLLFTPPP